MAHKKKPVKQEVKIPPLQQPVKKTSYRIVGTARISKSGQALSIKLIEGVNNRYLTISKSDLIRIFTDGNNQTVADVREYDAINNEVKNG
jgi:hypothetical protein